ncbi:MAG: FAD-dependent oxidoreductase, partial [Clostridiales Family XIII bacterium]|nr:FAD-dependent oxidoreductase [Clostridiales Family XIII bacterium]
MIDKNIVVIGAGPAGLGAAIEAAKHGVKDVLVIDINMKAGGQLFKQIHKFFGSAAHRAGVRGIAICEDMLTEAAGLGVEIWLNSTALGIFDDKVVQIEKKVNNIPEIVNVKAQKIIISTGASENAI